jgi:hypothetical protein
VPGKPKSAGINRHVVGDARALQERKYESILTSCLAGDIVRCFLKQFARTVQKHDEQLEGLCLQADFISVLQQLPGMQVRLVRGQRRADGVQKEDPA